MHLILRKMNSTLLPRYKISQILFCNFAKFEKFYTAKLYTSEFLQSFRKKLAFTIVFIKLTEVNLHMTEKT